jgi:hypothetical protein
MQTGANALLLHRSTKEKAAKICSNKITFPGDKKKTGMRY